MRSFYLILVAALLTACASQPVYRTNQTPLPVAQIEIEPYLGLWYEQARLPNRFERDCVRATARYGQREDGLISVLNTCHREDGQTREARGRARPVGEGGEGKLKVSFFGPIWADYWVLERAPDYSWSIVGEPEGRYLWLLTRTQRLAPAERAAFEQRISRLGYRPSDLYWAPTSE
jgi:apolipoprotein D and lipocalin family protein